MHDEDGITVTLSPVQMAAILNRQTVDAGETMSNRIWGGFGVISGVVEMLGAGVLCVAPEPTMLSKAGCVVVGSHSLDTITTSFRQAITGRQEFTATAQLAEMAAGELGASADTAYKVGVTVDIAVPFAFAGAAGAARVGSIYTGRIRLIEHEGDKLGHTISRHVGRTSEQLFARVSEARGPSRVSSFRNLRQAELLISEVLSVKKNQLVMTLKHMQPGARVRLDHRFRFSTGIYVEKGSNAVKKAYAVRVVLEARKYSGKVYYIVTAFPVP